MRHACLAASLAVAVFSSVLAGCSEDPTPSTAAAAAGASGKSEGGAAGQASAAGGRTGTGGTLSGGAGSSSQAGSAGSGSLAGGAGQSGSGAGSAAQAGSAGSPAGGVAGAGGSPGPEAQSCAKGTVYDFAAPPLGGGAPESLCTYAGNVLLVVNVASKCGYTPQYKPLQALYKKYETQGLVVLGFPSANFGDQEFHDDKEISEFCTTTYGITFPMFSRVDVKGPAQHPLYAWLTTQPGVAGEISWNFNKFLIDKQGKVLSRYDEGVSPDSAQLTAAVEAALAAP